MFTGLILCTAPVCAITDDEQGCWISVQVPEHFLADVAIGDSIACNGVCLTVTDCDPRTFSAFISKETCRCTTLASLKLGQSLNLEKSLKVGDKLAGHWVQGHVDGVSQIIDVQQEGSTTHYWLRVAPTLSRYLVYKGSVALDGISLTVNEIKQDCFRVTLIPHTQQVTNASVWTVEMALNIEIDLMARYAEKLLHCSLSACHP